MEKTTTNIYIIYTSFWWCWFTANGWFARVRPICPGNSKQTAYFTRTGWCSIASADCLANASQAGLCHWWLRCTWNNNIFSFYLLHFFCSLLCFYPSSHLCLSFAANLYFELYKRVCVINLTRVKFISISLRQCFCAVNSVLTLQHLT